MTPYDHPDYLSLYTGVLADPGADLPRLVLADWLDEHAGESECGHCKGQGGWTEYDHDGEGRRLRNRVGCPTCDGTGRVPNKFADRAEFIRVQCELATFFMRTPRYLSLEQRAKDLLDSTRVWAVKWPEYRRPSSFSIGVPSDCDEPHADVNPWLIFRRGFVDEFRGPLAAFLEVAPRLAAEFPVTAVTLTDRDQPEHMEYCGWVWWHEEHTWDEDRAAESTVPAPIFSLLDGVLVDGDGEIDAMWKSYDSVASAMRSLSDACVAYSRHESGLSPLGVAVA